MHLLLFRLHLGSGGCPPHARFSMIDSQTRTRQPARTSAHLLAHPAAFSHPRLLNLPTFLPAHASPSTPPTAINSLSVCMYIALFEKTHLILSVHQLMPTLGIWAAAYLFCLVLSVFGKHMGPIRLISPRYQFWQRDFVKLCSDDLEQTL